MEQSIVYKSTEGSIFDEEDTCSYFVMKIKELKNQGLCRDEVFDFLICDDDLLGKEEDKKLFINFWIDEILMI